MKMKNELFENKQYFETIEKIHLSEQLSVMDAYRINRLVKKLNELNEEYTELKTGLLKKFGTEEVDETGNKTGSYFITEENRKVFNSEYGDLLDIEHDLETEMLAFPSKLEDGFSAADLNIMEIFFDLSGFEPEEKTEDEPESSTEEST